MQRAFKTIYYTVLGIIIATGLLLIISVFPFRGNIKFLVVASGSMEPTIKTGSLILVKPAPTYATGDIITFGPNTATTPPTTHRIVGSHMKNNQLVFVTRGDANNGSDNHEVTPSEIVGKVRFWLPYAGYVIQKVKQPFGFMLIIILPAALIIYDELKKIFAEARNLRTRKHHGTEEKKH